MKYVLIIFFVSICLPLNALCQNELNDIDSKDYKSFLSDVRKSDTKRFYKDYSEDRSTRYRKLRERLNAEEREAYIAGTRAWEDRAKDSWDTRMSYIEKGYSASTDRESGRAFEAADQLRPTTRSRIDVYRR